MGAKVSSWLGDNDATEAPQSPPPSPSSSSHSAASSSGFYSSSDSSVGDSVQLENGSKVSKYPPTSADTSSSSSSSSSFLLLSNVGDSSASATASVVGSDGSSSCSDAQVEIEPVTPKASDWTSNDRCPYYPPRSDGCTEPRSCRDCLNIDVGDAYSCMVNQYGRCVKKTPANYVKALNFHHQGASNNGEVCEDQKVQFPANDVDYCPYGDKECKKCKKTVFADVMDGRINGSLTKFCYGKNGCVCIAVCEAPIWKSTIGQTVCNGTVVNKDYESQHANTYGGSTESEEHGNPPLGNLMMAVVGGVAAVVVLVAAVMYVRKRRNAASEDSSSGSSSNSGNAEDGNTQEGDEDGDLGSVPMAVPVAPTLSLFGWQAMRSELIEREQLLLAGVEDFSNVRTGYLQLLDVDASAPPQEDDESSAPVLLVPLAGASAPSFSPRGIPAFPAAPSAPLVSPSAPPASPTLLEEELL
ncbi:Hypothetical protein PHPALM_17237 [Phytophthora palmivora]|uniref:Uncharacterized protein n=1 Tax=Phytophthora palmivora TaxID=4796 RepID=A0A2P4XMQ4_9STRA|nr:Hypothetical protein PHPALM_17237 [Phytophthora palmivora]